MKSLKMASLLLLLLIISCQNDDDIINENPNPSPVTNVLDNYNPEVELIEASIIGFVVDEMDQPIVGAFVQLNNYITTTDDFGHFFLTDQMMNAKGTYIAVEKEGYFAGGRCLLPSADATNRVKVQLLTKNFEHNFVAQEGGDVNLSDGAAVSFESNSIVDESGNVYNGTVKVAAKWLDPTALETFDQMPGDLFGLSGTGEDVVLSTYGMISVELEGEAGEKLNISEGNTATISMPVPLSLQETAPDQIPLWYFDEEYGIWVEESVATFENGHYVGKVSHFSFWNYDVPKDYINLSLTLKSLTQNDDEGNPIVNSLVLITSSNVGSGSGYTDNNGHVNGFVPVNEELTLDVFDICGSIMYTQTIGPFTDDTNLGTIALNDLNSITNLIGQLTCNGVAVDNGLITVSYDGLSTYHYVDGNGFEFSVTTCPLTESLDVQGIDTDNLTQSDVISIATEADVDLGEIDICIEDLEEFMQITINGVTNVYTDPLFYTTNNSYTFLEVDDLGVTIDIGIIGATVGEFKSNILHIDVIDVANGWDLYDTVILETFTITEFGDIGGKVVGFFEGTLWDNNTNTDVPASGSFVVQVE